MLTRVGSVCLSFVMLGSLQLGCAGTTTESVANPSRQHSLSESSVITYDARGRGAYIENHGGKLRICAEPPPDASANLGAESSSSTKASLDALINAITVKAALDTSSSEKATSTIVDVATRTELLLVLRTATYRLCELNLNGVLTNQDALSVFDYILRTTRLLGQRDNVAKLIESLSSPNINDALKAQIVQLILAMSVSEAVAASTGLADQTVQRQATEILSYTFKSMFAPDAAKAVPGEGNEEGPDATVPQGPRPQQGGGR